jgi:surface carbohydrate biosynthesis protein
VFKARWVWRQPSPSPLLVYDAGTSELLLQYVRPWRPAVLSLRGEELNIPIFLESLIKTPTSMMGGYFDTFIRKVAPRVAVTHTDNNVAFYALAKKHPGLKTMFIQNGTRSIYGDVFGELEKLNDSRARLHVDRMLTFGEDVGKKYSRYITGSVVPIGSLKKNLDPRTAAKTSARLLFISQFREIEDIEIAGRRYSRKEYFESADHFVLRFLSDYAGRHRKSLSIVSCTSPNAPTPQRDKERGYYARILGHDCEMLPQTDRFSGYDATDGAEVVVSIDSTLGYESVARGNRTAILPVRLPPEIDSGLTFGWPGKLPDDGPFWTNRRDITSFEKILDHLFAISDEEFAREAADCGFNRIMTYDPGNTILSGALQEILGPPARTTSPSSETLENV